MVSILLYIRVTYSQKEKFPKSHDPNGLIDKKCYLTLADFSAFVTNAVNWLLMRQNSVHVFLQPICQQKAERKRKGEESPLSLHFIPPLISSSSWLEIEREIHSLSQFFILPLISSLSWLSLFLSRSLRLPFVPFPLIPDSRIQPYVLPCSRNVNGWFITN